MVITTLDNSELMKDLLTNLVSISGRKTNQRHALFILESTIEQLKKEYSFLENIGINDNIFDEETESITVMKGLDNLAQNEVGPAIKDIIVTLTNKLGNDAGHFFLKELSQKMNDLSIIVMKNMGVDLYIIQLEKEILKMEKTVLKKT
jgi:hypothetical protein